tara:strand:+ start:6176 stop:6298 length:123 start_codon:yes stop_codon:yes gene_type:complete
MDKRLSDEELERLFGADSLDINEDMTVREDRELVCCEAGD